MRSCVLALFSLILAAPGVCIGASYHLVEKVQVSPGPGIFDYAAADSVNRHVYFAHNEEVVVVDADSNVVVGSIPAPTFDPSYGVGLFGRTDPYQGVHHVAIADDLGRGFTANGRAASSTIFDLKTLKKIGEVKLTGIDPNAIVYDSASKRVFAFNEGTHDATVFDATSGQVLKTIKLDGSPAFAAADDKGHVFVNIIKLNLVQRIDARTLLADQQWPVGCKNPEGSPQNETMAIDKIHDRLFVGCRPDFRRLRFPPGPRPDRIMQVMDTINGRVVSTIPIGGNPDEAAFDPGTGLVFSANGEGSVTVIKEESPDKYKVIQTIITEPGAARLAVDLKTHKLFLPNNDQIPSGRGPNFRVLVFSRN